MERKIEIEKPIPWTYTETADKFRAAINKAQMFYDNVEISEGFQYALISNDNGSKVDRKEVTLMYTSEIDKEIHTVRPNYSAVAINDIGKNSVRFHKDGFLRIQQDGVFKYGAVITLPGFGVIAHNGRELLPPRYITIEDIQEQFILTSEHSNNKEDLNKLVDYDGHIWLEFITNSFVSNLGIKHGLTINDDPVTVLSGVYAKEFESIEIGKSASRVNVYIIYKKQLYRVMDYYIEDIMYTGNNRMFIREEMIGHGTRLKQSLIPEELVAMGELVKPNW